MHNIRRIALIQHKHVNSKLNVIVCVTTSRPHRFVSFGTRMGGGPLTSGAAAAVATEGERKEKGSERSYPNTGVTNMTKKSINLLRGWPSTSLLPAAALRTASQTALSDPRIWAPGLEYGPDPGYQPLREALARWLGRFYGGVIPTSSKSASTVRGGGDELSEEHEKDQDQHRNVREKEAGADRITITGGASQSLACLLQSFTDPVHTLAVWVVAPCYFLACPIFEDAGFAGRLRAVPEDAEGPDIAVLEREMRALEKQQQEQEEKQRARGTGQGDGDRDRDRDRDNHAGGPRYKDPGRHRKIYRHVVYCVPAFSNPSGRTTGLARRQGLVELARRYDALVICDDVYDMLQWQRLDLPPPPPPPHPHPPSSSPSPSPSPSSSQPPPQASNPFHTALLPRIADIDIAKGRSPHDPPGKHFGHAVSNGSFSKLVAPGTRTGWTYSTADLATGLSQTGSTRSGGAASQLAATIICELLLLPLPSHNPPGNSAEPTTGADNGEEEKEEECVIDTHIRHTLLPSYARRHAVLARAIRDVLVPLGVRVVEDSLCGREGVYGGYFVWMALPRETGTGTGTPWPTARAIADRCRADEDLMIGNGELFAVYGDEEAARFQDAIRLCFAWEDEEDLVDGVERLGRVIRRMLDGGPDSWGVKVGELGDVDQAK
ncbi:pyridoxal phosphate-dependent transferase [Xylaria sp. FL1777]|nr:pyridoxal phosphate-dependent transferase [Xylaria sp. FL1777]